MDWSDAVILSLRTLWDEGLSTAEIGRRLGVTKNAVVGKAHRLDLPARPSPIRRGVGPAVPRRAIGSTLPSMEQPDALPPSCRERFGPPALHALSRSDEAAPLQTLGAALTVEPAAVRAVSVPFPAATPAPVAALPAAARLPVAAASVDAAAAGARAAPAGTSRAAPMRAASALRPVAPPRRMRVVACCWPIGEPGTRSFRFCDADSMAGKPYCDTHAQLAYVKVRDRRDDAA